MGVDIRIIGVLISLCRVSSFGVFHQPRSVKDFKESAMRHSIADEWRNAAASLALAVFLTVSSPFSAFGDEASAGFEEFAAKGGTMKTNPSCFFDQCGEQSTACFTNPSCLKGITCLGNCRGEQLCATQCFARFGSEKLNNWLSCTLEEKECVTTGVKQVL